MARPKGSKNKIITIIHYDKQNAALTKEIKEMTAALKAEKAERDRFGSGKAQADKAAAAAAGVKHPPKTWFQTIPKKIFQKRWLLIFV